MKQLSPTAVLEVRRLNAEIEKLMAKAKNEKLSRSEMKEVDGKIAQISAIKEAGLTDSEYQRMVADELGREIHAPETRAVAEHEELFQRYMHGENVEERAGDFLAGSQTIHYTAGPEGGVLVPQSFQKEVTAGLAQVDPLLDPDVCTVIQEPGLALRPLTIPGWDLSTIAAVEVNEGAQHSPDTVPEVSGKLLNKFTYRLSLGASLEWEQDVFDSAMARMGFAYGVGFARGIGKDLVGGDGSSAPAGILNGLSSAYTNQNTGKVVLDDITGVYFSVNRIYRASKKCGWLMNDAAYKLVRNAVDGAQRPLIHVVDDKEELMGKPIYISPSLPTYNASLSPQYPGSFCVFGDLSYFNVHASTLFLRRRLQAQGYVEYGKALYTGLLSVDSVLFDPTAGAMPPVVAAALKA